MSSRLLASILKNPIFISINCGYRPLRMTQKIVPRSTSYSNVRNLSQEIDSSGKSSDAAPSISATIVAELRKANVRCTRKGIQELEEVYAGKTYLDILGYRDPYDLWYPWEAFLGDDATTITYLDLNTAGTRQWRNKDVYDFWVLHKVYKLREALYKHSPIFKDIIDFEESNLDNFHTRPCCLVFEEFSRWLEKIISCGIVEREDVEALPEVMFRDIVIGSGRSKGAEGDAE
ncbi:hypothetical protein AA313_de0203865 [Arthrobotrys entomopaga]|nr:hypothetical protein AA313_de0203865 [Arthrobotrys entomopaga]